MFPAVESPHRIRQWRVHTVSGSEVCGVYWCGGPHLRSLIHPFGFFYSILFYSILFYSILFYPSTEMRTVPTARCAFYGTSYR